MSGICDTCQRLKRMGCGLVMDGLKSCDWYEHESRYDRLFGTPERAARTLESMSLDSSNWCRYDAEGQLACKSCPCEFDSHGCYDPASLLEWLRGDA